MIVLMSICLLAVANAEAAQRVYPFQNKEISGRFLREKRATVYGECSETEGCSYEELSEAPYRWGYHRICQYFKSWKCGERNCGAGYMCATWSSNGCQRLNSYQVYCQEIDECSSSPCLNNGRCLDRVNSYYCKCAAGFEGTRCEKEIQTSKKDAVETKDPFEYTTPQPTSTGSKAHARYSTTFKSLISSLKENPLNTSYLSPISEITILKTTMQQKTNYSPNGIMSTTSDDFMSTHPDDRMSTTSMPKIPDGLMSTEDNVRIITRTTLSSATTTTTPPLPQRSDISCNADSIDTFVPFSMLPSGAPLTWRDPTCSVTSNGTHMISSIGLSQCGTTVTITKDNVEFENELKAQSTNSTANSLIDFGEDAYVIPVKCIYPRTETPMTSYVPLQQHVRFYEKRYGHFDVDIMQYDSDKFSSAIQNLGTPRKVALNSEIYVEVKLNDQFNNGLGIHIDKCIATPTSSPSDSTLYTLLTDGCPASQHVHLYNSPANKVRFGVRAFQFTSQTGAMVYIHCQTSMCQAGTPYCTSNCVTAGRRKRDVAPDQKSHLVSAGPFVLVADEQGTPIRMSTIVASVSAFVAVVACVVAIVGWTRKARTTSTKEQGLL